LSMPAQFESVIDIESKNYSVRDGAMEFVADLTWSALPSDISLNSFNEKLQKIDAPMRPFAAEIASLSTILLDIQRDITSRRCVVKTSLVDRLISQSENLNDRIELHYNFVDRLTPVLADFWTETLTNLRRQQVLFHRRIDELDSLRRSNEQILVTAKKLQPLVSFVASVISAVDNRRTGLVAIPPMEQICLQITTLAPDSQQRVSAIEKGEENRRLIRERERLVAQEEARSLKKGLRGTRRARQRPVSMIIVENSRDRDQLQLLSVRTSNRRHKIKHSSMSEESSPSPHAPALDEEILDTNALHTAPQCSHYEKETLPNEAQKLPIPAPPPQPPPPPPSERIIARNPAKPSTDHLSDETRNAHLILMQSIKEKVKRID